MAMPHADWEHFLGRFHPLALHLPIGFLLLIPVLEIAGARRPALREAAGFVLPAGVCKLPARTCAGLYACPWRRRHGPGASPGTWRGGITLTICALLCVCWRDLAGRRTQCRMSIRLCSPALLLALVWTAHQGGTLTHGSNYLTQYMPAGLKRWSGLGPQPPPATSFYAKHINPIFDSNCIGCHGERMVKGGLRLDSYEMLMNGGRDGPVIFAGQTGQEPAIDACDASPGS